MPVFATLVAAAINGLTSFYAVVLAYQQAIAWARRTFIVLLIVSFLAAIHICISGLLDMVSGIGGAGGGDLWGWFLMGLGMFIPGNAAVVVSCLASVWLACVVYRLKLEGLRW